MARGQKMDRRGIVGGRGRLLRDYYKEQREEEARWGKQRRKGEKAREIEAERGNLWSMLGTGASLLFGVPLPIAMAIGSGVGNIAKGVGTWDDGKRIEDIGFMDKNVGKFEKGQIEDVKDYNRALSAYDKKEFWKGIGDVAKSAAYAYISPKVQSFLGERATAKSRASVSAGDIEGTFDWGQEVGETFGATPETAFLSEESLGFSMPGEGWQSAPQAPGYTPHAGYVPDYPRGHFPSDAEVALSHSQQPSYSFPEPEAFGPPGSGGMWEGFFNRPGGRY